MEKITGKNNELVKDIKKLFTSPKERKDKQLFVLEGVRLVFDILNSFYEVKYFLITQSTYEKNKEKADLMIEKSDKAYFISDDVSSRLSDTQTSQGVFAVCKMKKYDNSKLIGKKYIALDNVQDPGNLGGISRSAQALGLDGIIIFGGCDMYNPKALRASMGSLLKIPVLKYDSVAEFAGLVKDSFLLLASVPNEDAVNVSDVDFSKPTVCFVGNEANGVSDEVLELVDEKVTIPMLGQAESLNACIAASIIMWEMLK